MSWEQAQVELVETAQSPNEPVYRLRLPFAPVLFSYTHHGDPSIGPKDDHRHRRLPQAQCTRHHPEA